MELRQIKHETNKGNDTGEKKRRPFGKLNAAALAISLTGAIVLCTAAGINYFKKENQTASLTEKQQIKQIIDATASKEKKEVPTETNAQKLRHAAMNGDKKPAKSVAPDKKANGKEKIGGSEIKPAGTDWQFCKDESVKDFRELRTQQEYGIIDPTVFCSSAETDPFDALVDAIKYDYTNTAKWLIERGLGIKGKNESGMTALMAAVEYGRTGIAEGLIASGVDIDAKDKNGKTALMIGADDIKMARLLIAKGADVNARDDNGATALMYSARTSSNYMLIEDFIAAGADVNARDIHGKTALMVASEFGNSDIVEVLIGKKASTAAQDENGKTALMWAAGGKAMKNLEGKPIRAITRTHFKTAELLIYNGCNVNAKDKSGKTAVDITDEMCGKLNKYANSERFQQLVYKEFVIFLENHGGKNARLLF